MFSTLIVEDNAAHRQSLHQLLARRFPTMEIAEARDCESVLQQTLSRHFDLIFMDLRLAQSNGFDLTQIIKKAFADAVVCIVTGYDILEYREEAFRNGADHFMVKGDSTETEIVELVESLLQGRFVALLIVSDDTCRGQIGTLLSIRWPAMVVAEAGDPAAGLSRVAALKPNLVLLELSLQDAGTRLIEDIRTYSPQTIIIGLTEDIPEAGHGKRVARGLDYCLPLTTFGHTRLMAIVDSLQVKRPNH